MRTAARRIRLRSSREQRLHRGVAAPSRRPHLAPRAVTRTLVGPEAHEARPVPEAVLLQLVEADLADELRSHRVPVELLATGPATLPARDAVAADVTLLPERREHLVELPPHRGREPRRVADEVEAVLVVVEAEQDRRDLPLDLLAPAKANDHAIGGAVLLHLDDTVARAREVRHPQPLADDAVEPRRLEPVEPARRVGELVRARRDAEPRGRVE